MLALIACLWWCQVRFLEFINNAQIKAAQRLSKAQQDRASIPSESTGQSSPEQVAACGEVDIGGDFFTVIQRGKEVGVSAEDEEVIWGSMHT